MAESQRELIGNSADPKSRHEDGFSFITLSMVATAEEGVSSPSPAIICNNDFVLKAGRDSQCSPLRPT